MRQASDLSELCVCVCVYRDVSDDELVILRLLAEQHNTNTHILTCNKIHFCDKPN